jgi:Tfp pilus assembly protein PilF
MARRRLLPALLVTLLLPAASAWSQRRPPGGEQSPRNFTIRGTLRLQENERTVSMVKVDLRRFTGEMVQTTFTGTNGEFEFTGLSTGVYIIFVDEEGFEPIRHNVEIISTPIFGLFLYLQRTATSTAPPPPGHSISVRELTMPRKAKSALDKGIERLFQKKDPEGSLSHFRRALEEMPTYYEAYHYIGLAQMDMGRTAEAENSFRKAIELSESRFAEPHFALGSLLSGREKFSEAEGVVRRGLQLDAQSWQGYHQLARALFGLNRVEEAEKSIQAAIARRSEHAPLYLLSANIHIRLKQYPALLKDLDEYLKLDPNGPQSNQARQMRESVRRAMDRAQSQASPPPPRP